MIPFRTDDYGPGICYETAEGQTVLPIRPGEPLPYRLDVSGGRSGGGLTLFGSGFGNYGRDIAVHVRFDNKE